MFVRSFPFTLAATLLCLTAPRIARAQNEVYGGDELSSAPKLVSAASTARLIARSYPEDLRRSSTGGAVELQFVIGKDGHVESNSVEVISSPVAALGSAAKSVVERMEFLPGKKDGTAVRTRVQLPIVYKP